jgi:PilZ domain
MSNFPEFVLQSADPATIGAEGSFRQDRRKRVRMTVHWPLLIFRNDVADGVESTTHNLSSTGFFCFSHTRFDAGETLICTLRVPSHSPDAKDQPWILECRARVKRVEPAVHEGLFGLACEFEDYRLLLPITPRHTPD